MPTSCPIFPARPKTTLAVLSVVVVLLCLQSGSISAQSAPTGSDHFEVASIRPSGPQGGRPSFEFTSAGGIRATNTTLNLLIQAAYEIVPEQISGGPGWTDSTQYTVIAEGAEGDSTLPDAVQHELARKRLQTLLADRFHLSLRVVANSASGYALTVAKTGPKMTPAVRPGGGQIRQMGTWAIEAEGVPMPLLAAYLGAHLGALVVDKTGLQGGYTFSLRSTRHDGMPDSSDPEQVTDGLISAVQEIGLTLRREKSAADRYKIEHVEKPTEN